MRLLLVEDDLRLARYTSEFLEQAGYLVSHAEDAQTAFELFRARPAELVLLDLGLPDQDGLELTGRLRAACETPILILTARDRIEDRVAGLRRGADDYLGKPYDPRELLARVDALLRRSRRASSRVLVAGALEVRLDSREVWLEGKRVELTTQEFHLLAALAQRPGEVFSREALIDALCGPGADSVFERAIDVTVSRLRQKLEPQPRQPRYLKTVRNEGYVLASQP